MKKTAAFFFALLLFSVPLFYHPALFFPDRAKWAWIALLLPLPFLLGPALATFRGGTFALPQPRLPLLCLLGWAAISGLWATTTELWAASLASLLLGLGIATTASWAARTRQDGNQDAWPGLVSPLLAAGSLAAALGLLQATGIDLLGHPFDTRHALVSTFGNTNHAGEFLAPLAAAAFALAVAERGFWGHLGMIALFLIAAQLAASGVRAAWISSGAGILAVSWLLWRGLSPKQRALLVAPCLAAALGFFAPKLVLPRETNSTESPSRSTDTIEVRKKVYAASWHMIADRPLLGCGEGNFQATFPPYRDPEEIEISSHHRADPAESMVEEPHNDYLLFAAELGLVGAALLAWLGWSLLQQAKKASRSLGASIAYAGIVAIGVNALFRSPFTNPSSAMVFWVLLGLLAFETKDESEATVASRRFWPALPGLLLLLSISWLGYRALQGETRLAQEQREAAVTADPWDPRKWEILGLEHRLGKNPAAAAQAYQRLLALNPRHFNGRLQSGLVALELGKLDESRTHLEVASTLDANNPRLLRAQALLSYREGDDLTAIGRLRTCIAKHGDPNALREFGTEVEKAGNAERALKYYQAHLDANPQDARVWTAMGQIFRNRGDETESRRSFAQAHRIYGIEYLRGANPAEAEKQFRLMRKFLTPEDPAPDLYLAAAALLRKDRIAAEAALREAAAHGAKQESLRAPGLEAIAADPELRSLLPQ